MDINWSGNPQFAFTSVTMHYAATSLLQIMMNDDLKTFAHGTFYAKLEDY